MSERVKENIEKSTKRKRTALLVTLTPYDRFLRVRRMAKTLAEKGEVEVHVLSAMEKSSDRTNEISNIIHVHYVPVFGKDGGRISYILNYILFFIIV